MDIFSKITLYGGAALGAVVLMVSLMTLSNSENGMLTVEGVSHLSDAYASFFEMIKFFVYPWLVVAGFVFIRFLTRLFRK